MSSSKVSNKQRHDSFIKKAMSNPKVARAFFKCHLPSRIQEKIDFDTLAMQKDSFVDNTLGISFADMLFTVQFGKETGYLYLLVEHQSKADERMAFRLHKYMHQIIGNHLKKHPKSKYLPLVYPLVYYSGQEKYNAPLTLWELYEDPDLARSFFIEPFQLIDLHRIEDEELRKEVWSGTMAFIMKHIFERDVLPFLEGIKPLLEEIGKKDLDYMESILCYIIEEAESEKAEKVVEIFKEAVSEEKRGKIMSIAERLIEKGEQQGIQKGMQLGKQEGIQLEKKHIARNMLAKSQSITLIAEVTGLSEKEVKKLKQNSNYH